MEELDSMFGMVGYLMMCFAVSCVLTVIVAMFRPIKQHDDWKAWKLIVGLMLGVGVIPYGYAETMSLLYGPDLKTGVVEAIDEANVSGKLQFYKVIRMQGSKAHVIAIANDTNEFGWPERAVFEIDLLKDRDGWHADAYSIVNSFHRQRDGSTMPPYW
jgi:hypothetical protein